MLTDEKARFKYNLHLSHPEESDYYHEYRYYSHKYIQDPKVPPGIVVVGLISFVSLLQYVMRKQMYERAIMSITESHDFKTKVNERCGNNRKLKEQVREEMVEEIEIEGGYSKPKWRDILICWLALLPYTALLFLAEQARWFYHYTVQGREYSAGDVEEMTKKALGLTPARWEVRLG